MAEDTPARVALHELRPELLIVCGLLGIVGNLAPLLSMLAAWPIAEHDLVADTISDLARGPHKWIMDTGFYLCAAGLLALSIGAAHLHMGRWSWSAGLFCLALLALVIVLLGLWDNITPDRDEGMTVHGRLVFLLGPLFLAGPLLMTSGARRIGKGLPAAFVASTVLWIVFAAAFKLSPDDIDGLLEKIAVAAKVLWTLPLSAVFLRHGLART
jgi:hypothetical protein